MTMNVAGAFALVLCLTVTSSQQEARPNGSILPISGLSFATEKENEVSFERNSIKLVTSPYDNTEIVEAEVTVSKTEEVETEEVVEVEEIEEVKYENRWGIQLTDEEIDLLAKIVWVEARGESEAGQVAVVEVIFNRMVSEDFPDSLYEVLSEKNPVQFSSWKLRDTAAPTEKEYATIYSVLNGETNQLREDTLYFATKKLTSGLDEKIGGHYFCY